MNNERGDARGRSEARNQSGPIGTLLRLFKEGWTDREIAIGGVTGIFYRESTSIGRSLHVNIPEPAHSPGKQYFSPFASGILDIGKKLTRSS